MTSEPSPAPTAKQRDKARAALKKRLLERAERDFVTHGRSINCAVGVNCGPEREHPSCIGNRWRSDVEIACLCPCHDPAVTPPTAQDSQR